MNGLLQKINDTVAATAATARRSSFASGGGNSSSSSSSAAGFYISPPSSVNGYVTTPSGSSSSSSSSSSAAAAAGGLSPSPTIIYPCSVRRIEFTVPSTWMFTGNGNVSASASSSSASSTLEMARPTSGGGCRSRRQLSPTTADTGSWSPTLTTTLTRSTAVRSTSSNGGSRRYHIGDGQTVVVDNSSQRTRDFVIPIDYRGGGRPLGTIDPRLYKLSTDDIDDDYEIPDNHIGRIWFSVKYESQTEKLLVTIVKARNLASRTATMLTGGTSGSVGDHFIRLYLLPDERRYLQSKFKKKTSNPQFDEQFVFQISSKDVESRVLKLTVYEVDRLKRHVIVGHALYSMRDYGYAGGGMMDGENGSGNGSVVPMRTNLIWRDLEREVTEATCCDQGELQISLCYKRQLERLTVGVIEGKNLNKIDSYALPDVYVRVCLQQQSKVVKTKKTEVVRRSVTPSFNESFTFRVSQSDLDMSSIIVTVLQRHNSLHRDHVIGRVVLGSFMFSRGKELEHWNRMTSDGEDHVTLWHSLL